MQRVACYVAVVAIVLGGGAAFGADLGDDCQNLNVTLKEESSDVDPSDPTYVALAEFFFGAGATFDVCWSQEVIGTIQGTWVLCWREGLLIPNPVFDVPGVPTDPGVEVWGNPGVIHTKKGDIYVMSYGLSVWDYAPDPDFFIAFGGVSQYLGGTGAFAGATGWSTDSPKTYPPTYKLQSVGFICVPD